MNKEQPATEQRPPLPTVDEVRIQPATVAWDFAKQLGSEHPVVTEFYASPERAALFEALHHATPVATTCKPFVAAPYCRPTIHRRSIYLELDEGGVFAFKGTEPHATDLREEVIDIESARAPFFSSMLNEFATAEQKVPMALSMDEARDEADVTLDFQARYFARFGRLANIPLPLLIYRWGDDVAQALLDAVLDGLCIPAQRSTRSMVAQGLGTLVYYYPSLPLRASQQARHATALVSTIGGLRLPAGTGIHERGGVSFEARKELLAQRAEPWQVVTSWISLVADMMVVGYFPLHTYFMGHCLQAQNLCIDGGTVDTDSLHWTQRSDDDLFHELFIQSVGELAKSATIYLTGTFVGRYTDQMLGNTIWQLLYDELRDRTAAQPPADPRLADLIGRPHAERVDHILTHLLRGVAPGNAPRIS
ncbi:MAG: hypothetical protein KUG77_03555 [Nannocystaceae bacterium]|nr:hypothetical protein [Nannocystaceae bacterium]